jgi:hypothetical protein
MDERALRISALTLTSVLAIAACSPAGAPGVGGGSEPTPRAVAQQGSSADVVACGETPAQLASWPVGDDPDASVIPLVLSSLVSVGPSRFLFGLTDDSYRVISSPEVSVGIALYALARDAETPAQAVEAAYLDTQLGRGLYRAAVDFDCAGEWGAEVTARLEDGSVETARMRFTVHPQGTTPAVGEPAPRSDSPTASTLAELRLISTDPDPFPGSFERTVAEVVSAGMPSLVFFATPAFCQTGYCGPTVNLVKSVAIDYQDRIGFVNVEPYELHMSENGLQPWLDEDGRLIPVQAVLDYGIPVEPYLFLVDADGDVFAKFEGVVGADELRASIEDVLAQAAA